MKIKWMFPLAVTGFVLWACNASTKDSEKRDRATGAAPGDDDSTRLSTHNVGDTSSYERMPQQMTDSVPH